LLLLLLILILYRRYSSKSHQQKQPKRRLSLENNLIHDTAEYHIPPIHTLPTIVEESSPLLSPTKSCNQFSQFADKSTTDSSSSNNVQPLTKDEPVVNVVRISIPIKDESTTRRRRSRFEQEPITTTTEPLSVNKIEMPPVVNRKYFELK